MENKTYYITTPIYYASGNLTLGHCFCNVLADACARFKRLDGFDVLFSTGSDEHGMKVMRSAEKFGLTPKQFVDKTVDGFKKLWEKLGIKYDVFIRTTDEQHIKIVKNIAKKLFDQGDIYLGKYEGLYCVPCETYFTDSQLLDGKCPDCGREVEKSSEQCYFFRLSKYQKFIEDAYNKNEKFLMPESRKNEVYNSFIKPGLQDLCVTRSNFDWGVKTPFDEKHVLYVWIDALINYISLLNYSTPNDSDFKKYWPADVHLFGRDITRFHAVVWPILLHALGLDMPKQLHSTGFLTQKGDRISKSKSNSFDPSLLVDRYGVDAIRYYLLKEGPIYTDMPYTPETLLTTINSDLCNDLGNLVNRTVAMISQYNGGRVKKPNSLNETDNEIVKHFNQLYNICVTAMNEQRTDTALKEIISAVRSLNKYIDVSAPWTQNKQGNFERLDTILYVLAEGIRICAVLLKAFLVEIPAKILSQLNVADDLASFESIAQFSFENHGAQVLKGDVIYSRLDIEKELVFLSGENVAEKKDAKTENKKEDKESAKMTELKENNQISIDEFSQVELKVGTIIKCDYVEGSDKLLKSIVQADKERSIVSGIAKQYNPADLVGRQVIVVTNLKPVKIKGILSEGMLLCAEDESGLSLLTCDKVVKNGSEIC